MAFDASVLLEALRELLGLLALLALEECQGHLSAHALTGVTGIDAILESVIHLAPQELSGSEPGAACRELGQPAACKISAN